MILEHQHFDISEKTILERLVFTPPLKAQTVMENEACMIYSVNGTSTLYSGAETDGLTNEESLLMKCGSFINHWRITQDDRPYEAIVIHFYPHILKEIYENQLPDFLQERPPVNPLLYQKILASEVMKNYIDGLLFYFKNPGLFTTDLVKLKVRELILLLYNMNSGGIREILSDLFNPQEVAFKEVIKKHLLEDLSMEDYVQLTNLSLSSFKRKFKEVFNDSPARYIKNQRLEKAAEWLRLSHSRISDICYNCGFNGLGHFSKSFAAKYKLSPTDYQKQHLSQIS